MTEMEPLQEERGVDEQPAEVPAEPQEAPAEGETAEAQVVEDVEALCKQLEEEQRKAAEYYDQWLRSVAELRNYKKRVDQEREAVVREANAGLIGHLLPALDDFERAIAVLPDQKLARLSWVEGILLIYRRIQAVLEHHGLRAIEAVGQPFDPYLHEGILFEEVPPEQDQIVLAELQKGYKLNDRVLRPALVKVGRAAVGPPPEEGPAEEKVPAPESEEGPASEHSPGSD